MRRKSKTYVKFVEHFGVDVFQYDQPNVCNQRRIVRMSFDWKVLYFVSMLHCFWLESAKIWSNAKFYLCFRLFIQVNFSKGLHLAETLFRKPRNLPGWFNKSLQRMISLILFGVGLLILRIYLMGTNMPHFTK